MTRFRDNLSPNRPAGAHVVALAVSLAAGAWAHPAIGIVMDAGGAVFYSDTTQVWRIAADGSKTVAVPAVHTHELWLDKDGNLYGIHEMAAGGWSHRVWKRSPDGQIRDLIPARPGVLEDYKDFSTARDSRNALYWLVRGANGGVYRRQPGGDPELIFKLAIDEPGWLSVLPDGTALVGDHGTLIRVPTDGKGEPRRTELSANHDRYAVMAAWASRNGGVYVAVYGSSAIKRIAPGEEVTTVAVSPSPWQPTAGLEAPDGALWILETSPDNAQRVRRIGADGTIRVF